MTLEAVTDVFAFVLAEGQFTQSILFAKDMPEELTPDERKAVEAVLGHVRASYVALLDACRTALLASASSEDAATKKTLESSWNRDNTLWERGRVQLPLVVKQSWNAWLTIGLWPRVKEPKGSIGLHGHLGVQQRNINALAQAAGSSGAERLTPDGVAFTGMPIQPKEGDRFDVLGKQLASELWPVARELRRLLLTTKAATPVA